MSLSLAPYLTSAAAGGAAPTYADITTAEILGPTPELDAVSATGDTTPPLYGVVPNGWVLKLTMPYLVGQSLDASKIHLLVSDPGYDTDGSTVTRTRFLTGSEKLREQCTTTGTYVETYQESNDGTTYTVYLALRHDPDALRLLELSGDDVCYGDGVVYAGTTIVSLTAEAGFYGAAQDGTFSGTVTNSSTRTYYKPEPAYLNTPGELVGATRAGEVAAYHQAGQRGQMVAAVKVRGRDTTGNTTAWTTVGAPTLSTIQTQGQIVETFAFSYSTAALNQGEVCRDQVQVLPWIGDSSAICDSEDYTGVHDPRRAMRWVCDRTGAYGGAVAVVDPVSGDDGTGDVGDTHVGRNPYLTLHAAASGIAAWNNTNRSHNDTGGGTIYLYTNSGSETTLTPGANITATAGDAQIVVRQHPSNSGSVVLSNSAQRTIPTLWRFVGVNFVKGVTAAFWTGGVTSLTGEGHVFIIDDASVALNSGATTPWLNQTNRIYLRNVTYSAVSGSNVPAMGTNGTQVNATMLALGVICDQSTHVNVVPYRVLGCRLRWSFAPKNASQPSTDGLIVANNILKRSVAGGTTLGEDADYSRGVVFVQNVMEFWGSSTSQGLGLSGDGSTNNIDYVVNAYNSSAFNAPSGTLDDTGKCNMLYVDKAAARGKLKRGVQRFNVWPRTAMKGDDFDNTAEGFGRVGNWEPRYKPGFTGNVLLLNRNPDTGAGSSPTWWGEFIEPYGAVNAGMSLYRDNQGGAGTGGGDYRPTTSTSNPVRNRVPVNNGMLKYDLAGAARVNDGTGAAGAYEWSAT